jgi:hypothetical protein
MVQRGGVTYCWSSDGLRPCSTYANHLGIVSLSARTGRHPCMMQAMRSYSSLASSTFISMCTCTTYICRRPDIADLEMDRFARIMQHVHANSTRLGSSLDVTAPKSVSTNFKSPWWRKITPKGQKKTCLNQHHICVLSRRGLKSYWRHWVNASLFLVTDDCISETRKILVSFKKVTRDTS